MPSKTSPDTLASFIRQLDTETLSSVLIELATDHAAVHERLVRLQLSNQPRALGTVFRKKLAAWKRSTKYVDYSQVGEFGRELHAWLEQVCMHGWTCCRRASGPQPLNMRMSWQRRIRIQS